MVMAPQAPMNGSAHDPGVLSGAAMADDPMAVHPVLAELSSPWEPGSDPMDDELVKRIFNWLKDGQARAYAVNEYDHDKWKAFSMLKASMNPADDPNDPLVALGVYFPILARLWSVAKAGMMADLIADPAEMDFFSIRCRIGGLASYGELSTEVMRSVFRKMKPEDVSYGFFDLLDTLVDCNGTYGNCFGTATYKAIFDDGGNIESQGPCVEWLDNFNCWPWSLDVGNIAQTEITIWSPIDDDDLFKMDYPAGMAKRVWLSCQRSAHLRRDPRNVGYGVGSNSGAGWGQYWFSNAANSERRLFERRIHFVRFPTYWLLDQENYKSLIEDSDDSPPDMEMMDDPSSMTTMDAVLAFEQAAISKLASIYAKGGDVQGYMERAFDKRTGRPREWWQMETIGENLCMVVPYELDLPEGCGPVFHRSMIKKDGWLLGDGLWDRGQWDERFFNVFQRAELKMIQRAAKPTYLYDQYAIEPMWLQQQGGDFTLEGLEKLPVIKSNNTNMKAPLMPLEDNERAIPMVQDGSQRRFESARQLTGVENAQEGNSQAKLATVNANNVAASRVLQLYDIRSIAYGMLSEIVLRMYVIQKQAFREGKFTVTVPQPNDESRMAMAEVGSDHMMDERIIDIMVTASNPLGSRQAQASAIQTFNNRWIPAGTLDIMAACKAEGKVSGVPMLEEILKPSDPAQNAMWVQNAQSMGPGWQQYLPPILQMQLLGAPIGNPLGGQGGGIKQTGAATAQAGQQPPVAKQAQEAGTAAGGMLGAVGPGAVQSYQSGGGRPA